MPCHTLIAGIGSHHGDDQFGWLAARAAADAWARLPARTHPPSDANTRSDPQVQLAKSPADLLDWLEGIDRLIVCDACRENAPTATLRRFEWPAAAIESTEFSGSHDLDLATVLHLAAELKQLPAQTVVWAVTGTRFEPDAPVSPEIVQAAAEVGRKIADEIEDNARHASHTRTCSGSK